MENIDIEALKILLASSEEMEGWSHGEVTKGETYSYRTYSPEPDGLFCERIFGPVHSYQCHCGKLKGPQYKGLICSNCGVEILPSSVRRERFGHIKLAAPVVHIWYFKNNINYVGLLLDMAARDIEKVIYYVSYVVIDPKKTKLRYKQILSDEEYLTYKNENLDFVAKKGGQAIKELLEHVDMKKLKDSALEKLNGNAKHDKVNAVRLLSVVEGLIQNDRKPSDMVLTIVPVIPPDLRPLVPLEGGKYASDDLNELYRRVINRNNRLKRLYEVNAPDIMLENEKRMLQESVDALFDNSRRAFPVLSSTRKPLRSLTDILKGKEGRFRENLLGKRVDYSGRAVIVVGPDLKLDQCGVPKEMALELFKPFVIYELSKLGINKRRAKEIVENPTPDVWKTLEDISRNYVVLLNRAPTLHRLSIQAFKPVLIEGKALQISPLVCTPFNADFDGDQMAIHLPLSVSAQTEAKLLMLSSHNILSPAHGEPLDTPVQDMVLGVYYLTLEDKSREPYGKLLDNPFEVEVLYEKGVLKLHDRIKFVVNGEKLVTTVGRVLFNTKVREGIFESGDLESFPFINKTVDKKVMQNIISQFYDDFGLVKTDILLDNLKELGFNYATFGGVSIGIDDIKIPVKRDKLVDEGESQTKKVNESYENGLRTESDRYKTVVDVWQNIAKEVEEAVFSNFGDFDPLFMMANSGARGSKTQITQMAGMRGLMSGPTGKVIEFPIKSNLREGLTVLEYFLSTHGARKGQADTALKTADSGYLTRRLVDVAHEIIVKEDDCSIRKVSITKVGDEIIEKLSDKVIGKISASDIKNPLLPNTLLIHKGDVISLEQAQLLDKFNIESILVEDPINGIEVEAVLENGDQSKPVISLSEQIWGRYTAEDIFAPSSEIKMKVSKNILNKSLAEDVIDKNTGEILAEKNSIITEEMINNFKKNKITELLVFESPVLIVGRNELIDFEKAKKIEAAGVNKVKIRSPITCNSEHGVCSKCYGLDLSSREEVKVGEAVGVVAAESIGEPGTQLTLRTFHTGGVAAEDITQGLPRVEELFSARSPKGKAIISPLSGQVEITIDKVKQTISIVGKNGEKSKVVAPRDKKLKIKSGDEVKVGDVLSDGSFDPHELLEIKGANFTARYLVEEIERVYKSQGVGINPKHIEIIIKRMFDKVLVLNSGDTIFYEGEVVDKDEILKENRRIRAIGKNIAVFKPLVQGITKSALSSDSFLSAASFQETPRVLAEAAIKGKVDLLRGMKESIIIGKKIPAGTNLHFEEDKTENVD
ncbi:MAG: DNA-directed RNA polymerase subunit beta' [Caldisericaceae bacterium]